MKKLNFKAWIPVICFLIAISWISTPLLSSEKDGTVMSLRQLIKTLSPLQRAQFDRIVTEQFQCPNSENQVDALTRMENIFKNLEAILTPEQLKVYRSLSTQPQKVEKVIITPPIQNCSSCGTSANYITAAIGHLNDADYAYGMADYFTYCTSPPYGIPDPISGSIDFALSYADDARTNYNIAKNTCNCTAAQQALEDLQDAIQFTQNAIDITNYYCTSNSPWLDELSDALTALNNALNSAQSCIDQACGISS